jgi:hypothetical protein
MKRSKKALFKVLAAFALMVASMEAAYAQAVVDYEKTCVAKRKTPAVCKCMAKNVRAKILSQDIYAEQMPVMMLILKGEVVRNEQKTDDYDNLADFTEELTKRCSADPKYDVNKN